LRGLKRCRRSATLGTPSSGRRAGRAVRFSLGAGPRRTPPNTERHRMTTQPPSGLPPSITLSKRDAARLEALLDAPQWQNDPTAEALAGELVRAEVVDVADMPADVVGLNSRVDCV